MSRLVSSPLHLVLVLVLVSVFGYSICVSRAPVGWGNSGCHVSLGYFLAALLVKPHTPILCPSLSLTPFTPHSLQPESFPTIHPSLASLQAKCLQTKKESLYERTSRCCVSILLREGAPVIVLPPVSVCRAFRLILNSCACVCACMLGLRLRPAPARIVCLFFFLCSPRILLSPSIQIKRPLLLLQELGGFGNRVFLPFYYLPFPPPNWFLFPPLILLHLLLLAAPHFSSSSSSATPRAPPPRQSIVRPTPINIRHFSPCI